MGRGFGYQENINKQSIKEVNMCSQPYACALSRTQCFRICYTNNKKKNKQVIFMLVVLGLKEPSCSNICIKVNIWLWIPNHR